jgi:hypothetical protein
MAPVAAAKEELAGAGAGTGASASAAMVGEALLLLERIARLRGALPGAVSGRAGFFVPLACGHNVAWGAAEQALLAAALDEAAPA